MKVTLATRKLVTEVYCMNELIGVFHTVLKPNKFIVN